MGTSRGEESKMSSYRTRMKVACFLVGLSVSATAGGAKSKGQVESRYSRDYRQCMATGEAANGITGAIMDCNGAEIYRQDARLNQAYNMVMMRLGASQKATLRAFERSWIA